MVGSTRIASEMNGGYIRKIRKPVVEKKRRDRMNKSIEQLKMLIADSIVDTASTKLDKADILDLTVNSLQRLKNQQVSVSMATDASSYRNGFKDCAREIVRYMSSTRAITPQSLGHLSDHLRTVYENKTDGLPRVQVPTKSCVNVMDCQPSRTFSIVAISSGDATSRVSSPTLHSLPPQFCSTPVQGLHSVFNSSAYSSVNSSHDSSAYSQSSESIGSVMDISRESVSCNVSDVSSNGSNIYRSVAFMPRSASESSSSDLILENIIQEEKPWRPW